MPQSCKPIPPLSADEIRRFWEKIDSEHPTERGCHLWRGTISDSGYGIVFLSRKRFKATRVLHFIKTGRDPGQSLIRHTCDVKNCVLFDHTVPGTNDDNMRDATERGRFARGLRNGAHTHPERRCIGEDQPGSKLTEAQVIGARERYASGNETCQAIAKSLGVSLRIITEIVMGKRWKHVGGPIMASLPRGPKPRKQ